MKGFPNQVADLGKLATGMEVVARLVELGEDARGDGVFGEALVRAGVAGTGHVPIPVEAYLRAQRTKRKDSQGFRTAARGLRELYRLLQFIDDSGPVIRISPLGMQAAHFAGAAMEDTQIAYWRRAIGDMTQSDADGTSHPYQVLLRLVARRPGITRAKCALALEAKDDSEEELDRIVALADLSEQRIRQRLRVSDSNWNNAKKILPRFAEQLGDVIKSGGTFVLADSPGHPEQSAAARPEDEREGAPAGMRAPRASRKVSADAIGSAGLADRAEPPLPPDIDPQGVAAAIAARLDRLRRHNLLVRALAGRLAQAGAQLYEDPFDILALFENLGILVEVKTLDGSAADERDRVRSALAQLLYYEAFVTEPVAGDSAVRKVACFERRPSGEHAAWLNRQSIAAIWRANGGFAGDDLAKRYLGRFLQLDAG